ncbi:unnamed protein product [Toxocara canis]|uniref:Pkinase_fungal domain-containing protein n=1 Tax=Toxocara canis TaxID=6265 RepID=A0A183U1Z4_TOXCA|nr:unnamed protein product [Toxocara canis]
MEHDQLQKACQSLVPFAAHNTFKGLTNSKTDLWDVKVEGASPSSATLEFKLPERDKYTEMDRHRYELATICSFVWWAFVSAQRPDRMLVVNLL